jgi:hypothetical protein
VRKSNVEWDNVNKLRHVQVNCMCITLSGSRHGAWMIMDQAARIGTHLQAAKHRGQGSSHSSSSHGPASLGTQCH